MKISGENKPKVTVLWLDDKRDPSTFFKRRILKDTEDFYRDLMSKYSLKFVWVKNYDEFVDYLETHKMPFLISFDYDLQPRTKKGRYCVEWLLNYCEENNKKLPKTFIHSTNHEGRIIMRDLLNAKGAQVHITDEDINKMVTEVVRNLYESAAYSDDDKLELIKDPNVKDGGNFGIRRNGAEFWVSRSNTISLYVFCKNENGELCILANKRGKDLNKYPNMWNVVCGYLDYGYTLEETAVKECFEETGVKIEKNQLINNGTSSKRKRGSVNTEFMCILNGITSNYPTNKNNCEQGEVSEVKWIPISEVKNYMWMAKQDQKILSLSREIFKNNEESAVYSKLKKLLDKKAINLKQFNLIIRTLEN